MKESDMKKSDLIINQNSSLYEEFAIDSIPTCDCKCPPGTVNPPCNSADADCCGNSAPSTIIIDACKISDNKDIQAELNCQGRLLTIRVILKCVCPNQKIAVGVILYEGNKVRGFEVKEIVTPPLPTGHLVEKCEHVVICKFCFILPGSLCCPLTLTPKVIAHYTNFNIDSSCSTDCPPNLPKKCCP